MKKVLILGGTGYIGTNLALYLCNAYDVTVTGRENTNEILNNFYKYFNSIFDSRKNPGSESLDTLGKNKNNFLITNKKLFGNNFNF